MRMSSYIVPQVFYPDWSTVYAVGLTEEDMEKPQVSITYELQTLVLNDASRSVSHQSGGKVCSSEIW